MAITKPYICEIAPKTYVINEFGLSAMYLLVGEEKALLIDTGCGICDLKQVVRILTDKPLIVVLTHAHMDHAGGMCAFEQVYLNEKDVGLAKSIRREDIVSYAEMFGKAGGYQVYDYSPESAPKFQKYPEFLPLNDGDTFDLGGRIIEAYTIPGHTAGSVTLLDGANRLMISGDCCNVNLLALGASIKTTLKGLKKFRSLADRFDQNFNGHVGYMGQPNCFSQPQSTADDLIHICEDILAGKGDPKPYEFLGVALKQMSYGAVKLSYDPESLVD
ncbi:MAG: MBL fold metallo-hydrolase [Clostridiales bacterium]|nr:MBL fold metallo-hydrolase [Clostridiales bacterium]